MKRRPRVASPARILLSRVAVWSGDCLCGYPVGMHFDDRNRKHDCGTVHQMRVDERGAMPARKGVRS